MCKQTGWLEIMGSGMVHPAVFEAVNARLGRDGLRPRGGHGLRLRPRHRARGHPSLRDRGHPPLLRKRPALPGAVPVMKVPVSWLREFVDVKVEPERLAEALTLVGLAVDGIDRAGGRCRPGPRRDHEPRRLHERLRRGPRGGGDLSACPFGRWSSALHEAGEPAGKVLRVTIEAAELCPRFCARVLDVRLGPSPGVDPRPPRAGRRPAHQQRGGPDELRDDGDGPALARLRPRPHSRGPAPACAGRAPGERLTTLDGVDAHAASRPWAWWRDRRPHSPSPGSWAEPRARCRRKRPSSPSRPPTGIRPRSVAPPRPWACTPRPRTASSAGPIPRRPRAATARIAHLLEKIGAGQLAAGAHRSLGPPARARGACRLRPARIEQVLGAEVPREGAWPRSWAVSGFAVDVARDGDARGPSCRPGAATWPARSTSWRRWRGTTASTRSRRPCPPLALPGGLLPAPGARAPAARAAARRRAQRGRQPRPRGRPPELDGVRRRPRGACEPAVDRPRCLARVAPARACSATCRPTCARAARDLALFEIGRVFAAARTRARSCPGRNGALASSSRGPCDRRTGRSDRITADFFAAKGLVEALAAEAGRASTLDVSDAAMGLPAVAAPGPLRGVWGARAARRLRGALHPDLQAALDARERGGGGGGEPRTLAARRSERSAAGAGARPFPGGDTRPVPALRRARVRGRARHPSGRVRGRGRRCARSEIRDRYVGERCPRARWA